MRQGRMHANRWGIDYLSEYARPAYRKWSCYDYAIFVKALLDWRGFRTWIRVYQYNVSRRIHGNRAIKFHHNRISGIGDRDNTLLSHAVPVALHPESGTAFTFDLCFKIVDRHGIVRSAEQPAPPTWASVWMAPQSHIDLVLRHRSPGDKIEVASFGQLSWYHSDPYRTTSTPESTIRRAAFMKLRGLGHVPRVKGKLFPIPAAHLWRIRGGVGGPIASEHGEEIYIGDTFLVRAIGENLSEVVEFGDDPTLSPTP